MPLKELTKFDAYFGTKVDYGFLGADSLIKLSAAEEGKLKEGATLRTANSGESVELGSEIAEGEEGIIYSLANNSSYVAKIYKPKHRTKVKAKKLKKMLSFKNENEHICWPCDILETHNGIFVGFIMPAVEGKILKSLTISSGSMKKKYPKVDRKVQIEIVLEFLNLFKYLHEHNILFGDINLSNIMFDDQYHVTFVDMDCVQVGEFPCITSTPGFDSPEVIIGRGEDRFVWLPEFKTFEFVRYYSDFYRTMEMECFSISVLIYSFFMHNFPPYDYREFGLIGDQGEYNDNELCMKQQFAYSTDADKVENNANHKSIWSHFPSFLKEAFVNCFVYNKRYTDDEWIQLFTRYKNLLESGVIAKSDPECMNPFPENQANYDALKFTLNDTLERNGFVRWHAVGRIIKALGDDRIKRQVLKISDLLKKNPEVLVYVTDDGDVYVDETPEEGKTVVANYRFRLVYNIGVLKKVKCEYVL